MEEVKSDVVDQLKRAMEGKLVGFRFTLDGEVEVRLKDGKQVDQPLAEEPLKELPSWFKPTHHEAVEIMNDAIVQLKTKMPKRQIPLTREEIVQAVPKKVLRQLEELGLVRQRIISLTRMNTGKTVGGRAVVYFTAQGRAYVREKVSSSGNTG